MKLLLIPGLPILAIYGSQKLGTLIPNPTLACILAGILAAACTCVSVILCSRLLRLDQPKVAGKACPSTNNLPTSGTGIWLQGKSGPGKSESVKYFLGWDTAKEGAERSVSSMYRRESDGSITDLGSMPVHVDEYRDARPSDLCPLSPFHP